MSSLRCCSQTSRTLRGPIWSISPRRRHSGRGDEAAAQALRSPESAAPGDLLQREIRLLEPLSCGSEADLPDIVAGREAHPVDEVPGETALAHRDSLREARHRQVLI